MTPAPILYETFEKRFRDLQTRYSRSRKHLIYLALITITLFIVMMLCFWLKGRTDYVFDYELYVTPERPQFVVDTPNCRIWNYGPFNDDVVLYKAQMNYSIDDRPGNCESLPLLTSVSRSEKGHTLHLHKEYFINYTASVENTTCCYSYIFSSALLFGEEENATVDEPKNNKTVIRGRPYCICEMKTDLMKMILDNRNVNAKDITAAFTVDTIIRTSESKLLFPTYMDCKKFDGDVKLEPDFDFVRVTCGHEDAQETPPSNVYKHFHSFVSIKREVRVKMDLYNETMRLGKKFENNSAVPPWEKPWSVMIIGLDSVSRLNLQRTMPKTVDYLDKNGWHVFEGYNRVGESTFSNLAAAVMAGSAEEQLRKSCAPTPDTPVDWCPWIWGKFSSQGYITAYGEDKTGSDTFYTQSGGFRHPPTDYFLRTLLKAADSFTSHDWYEKLIQYYDCVGKKHESEYIVDFSLEFAKVLNFYPTFSLFWLNSFSHDRLFGPKPMDAYFQSYLQNLTELVNDTILVFMSDHGMSHGFYRQTEMGFVEANSPFLYVWLPRSFQILNPKAIKNLKENKHKLVSHFDLYLTLLDLLGDGSKARGCPKCTSLFQPIPLNRTCADAGVPPRYCACTKYFKVANTSHQNLAESLVQEINEIIKPLQKYTFEPFKCANFSLKEIYSAKRVIKENGEKRSPLQNAKIGTKGKEIFVVSIETEPKALFEATISKNGSTLTVDNILRLDSYEKESLCLNSKTGKPYCICEMETDLMKKITDDEKAIERDINAKNESSVQNSQVNVSSEDSKPIFELV